MYRRTSTRLYAAAALFISLTSAQSALSQQAPDSKLQQPGENTAEEKSILWDPVDGWLDASRFLIEKGYGFLPVPIIITEPAVDNGLGLAGLFFHRPGKNDPKPKKGQFLLTDISAVGGAYTGNNSWAVGGYHFNTMRQDTLRYTGILGYADMNLTYFGDSISDTPLAIDQVGFNTKGALTKQQIQHRLGKSNWFLGAHWSYLHSDVSIRSGIPAIDDLPIFNQEVAVSGIGIGTLYEQLDTRLSPTKGLSFSLETLWNDDAIGSDYDYDELSWKVRQYFNFGNKFLLRWRFDGATTDGEVPFFLLPYVTIEGIEALRYQGDTAATLELRGGWQVHPRWELLAFAGGGRAADSFKDLGSAASHTSVGVGFRYVIARLLGMRAGLDIARGPDDTYIYLVTGSAW